MYVLDQNKKIRYTCTPANPSFSIIKVGFKWVYISRTCFPDVYMNTGFNIEKDTYLTLRDDILCIPGPSMCM